MIYREPEHPEAALPFAGRGGLIVSGTGAGRACALLLVAALGGCSGGDDTVPATGEPVLESPEPGAVVPGPPAPEDGQGHVRIVPDEPVPCGSRGTWAVEWIAGPDGLAAEGGAVLQVSPFWGWSRPQLRQPGAPGYTTVSTSRPGVELEVAEGAVPMTIVARVRKGRLAPGDTLRFVYGDTSGGAGGSATADTYAEAFEELLVKTDGNGDGVFVAPSDQPTLRILPGAAVRLAVAAPALIEPGEPLVVGVTALDARDNRALVPAGGLQLLLVPLRDDPEAAVEPRRLVAVDSLRAAEDRVVLRLSGLEEGLYRLEARLGDLAGRNELLLVERDSPFGKILWGDIHVHSALSDGTGAPEDLYSYAREVVGLDVCCVTDHDAHGLYRLDERGGWDHVRAATRDAYEPGEFVTLLGYEWTNWTFGHRNVYYPDLAGEVFAFVDPLSDTPPELWERIASYGGQTIPHHPGGGPVPVDWSVPIDPARETVVEICSVHGSSEAPGVERGIYRAVPGASVRDALARGHRLGILASGDTHDGHPGRRTLGAPVNGLAAFRAPEATREAVLAALRERRVYGTSGPRILLLATWGGVPAGSSLPAAARGPIVVRVAAPEPVQVVEVIGPGGVIAREWGGGRRLERTFEVTDMPAWAYVRVVLADGEVAWDSPWWPEDRT